MREQETGDAGTDVTSLPGQADRIDAAARPGECQRGETEKPEVRGDFAPFVIDYNRKVKGGFVFEAFADHRFIGPRADQLAFMERMYAVCKKLPHFKDRDWPANTTRGTVFAYLWNATRGFNEEQGAHGFWDYQGVQIVLSEPYSEKEYHGNFNKEDREFNFYSIVDCPIGPNLATVPGIKFMAPVERFHKPTWNIMAVILAKLQVVNHFRFYEADLDEARESCMEQIDQYRQGTSDDPDPLFSMDMDDEEETEKWVERMDEVTHERVYRLECALNYWSETGPPMKIWKKIIQKKYRDFPMGRLKAMVKRYRKHRSLKKFMLMAIEVIESGKKIHDYDWPSPRENMDGFGPHMLYSFHWDNPFDQGKADAVERTFEGYFDHAWESGTYTSFRLCRRIDTTKNPFKWPRDDKFPSQVHKMMMQALNTFTYLNKLYYGKKYKRTNLPSCSRNYYP